MQEYEPKQISNDNVRNFCSSPSNVILPNLSELSDVTDTWGTSQDTSFDVLSPLTSSRSCMDSSFASDQAGDKKQDLKSNENYLWEKKQQKQVMADGQMLSNFIPELQVDKIEADAK